jgi:hypothetical protein
VRQSRFTWLFFYKKKGGKMPNIKVNALLLAGITYVASRYMWELTKDKLPGISA